MIKRNELKREETQLGFFDESLTEQHHKKMCDVHTIMNKYEQSGIVQHTSKYQGTYGDFVSAPEFQDAQNVIAKSSSMFESIPAEIREEFNNNPHEFLEFIQNDENREKMEKMGFTTDHLSPLPKAPQPPMKVEVVSTPSETSEVSPEAKKTP